MTQKIASAARTTPTNPPLTHSSREDPGRQYVAALARGLSVLRTFKSIGSTLRNQDIAAATGLPKSSVSRLLYTLIELGYIDQSKDTGQYRLGAAAIAMGYATSLGSIIQHVAQPLMKSAANELDVCVTLGFRDGLEVVYSEHFRGQSVINLVLERGSRIPVLSSALGRALIVSMPAATREETISLLSNQPSASKESVQKTIAHAVENMNKHGFTLSIGEWNSEVNSIAVPLRSIENLPPFALSIGAPAYRMPSNRLIEKIGPKLHILADQINQKVQES